MVVSHQNLKVFFTAFLILILFSVNKIEVNVLVFFVGVFCFKHTSSSVYVLNQVSSLILVFLLGIIAASFSETTFFDFFKDVVYFVKPILAISFGFLLFGSLGAKGIYSVLIVLGCVFAVSHIYSVISIDNVYELKIHDIRAKAGLNNFIEVISLLVLVILKKNNIRVFSKNTTRLIFIMLIFSFVLYFSRTMLFTFLIMYLFAMGHHRLSAKGFIILCSGVIFCVLFYWYLFSVDLSIDAKGFEAFLYKMRMAPGELFINTSNLDINNLNMTDLRYLYDHWRGYEASRAINQLNGMRLVFGNGFGSLIDLGFETQLGGETIQKIPVLHNGYIYVMFKTGLLGLFLYLFFYLRLFLRFNVQFLDKDLNAINSIALAIVIFFVITSFVITGIYNQGDLISLIFGGVIWFQRRLFLNQRKLIS